jgi:hypothetical protein
MNHGPMLCFHVGNWKLEMIGVECNMGLAP